MAFAGVICARIMVGTHMSTARRLHTLSALLRSRLLAIGLLIVLLLVICSPMAVACTIGVANGSATADGRPLIWKVRDNAAVPNNEIYYNTSLTIPFVALVTANGGPDSPTWMGTNVNGFALVNANAGDLSTRANGEFMRAALGSCRSVREFQTLLEATNGIRDTHGNFGVMDTTGAVFIIEASRDSFWTYDTLDTERGFIIRTNFACVDTAGTGIDGLPGEHRFVRSTNLVTEWIDTGTLGVATLAGQHARDFSNNHFEPFPLPCYECGDPDSLQGYFDSFFSICAGGTVSASVIQGVAPHPATEPAWLTTFWVHLGQPACTIAAPYWPVGPAPAVANGPETAPICDLANVVRHQVVFPIPYYTRTVNSFGIYDGEGGGLWSTLLPVEAAIREVTDERLAWWRLNPPDAGTILAFEDSLANVVHELLLDDVLTEAATPAVMRPLIAYPNPFNPATTLAFDLAQEGHARLEIYDLAGRRVALILDGFMPVGHHRINWQPDGLASGVYVARFQAAGLVGHRRMVLLK